MRPQRWQACDGPDFGHTVKPTPVNRISGISGLGTGQGSHTGRSGAPDVGSTPVSVTLGRPAPCPESRAIAWG